MFVDLARQLAHEAGLPTTLDGVSRDSDGTPMGIISHAYCTANQPNNFSDHVDPYPYLAKWGISKEQFAKDLATGFGGSGKKEPLKIQDIKEEAEDMDEMLLVTNKEARQPMLLVMGGKPYLCQKIKVT